MSECIAIQRLAHLSGAKKYNPASSLNLDKLVPMLKKKHEALIQLEPSDPKKSILQRKLESYQRAWIFGKIDCLQRLGSSLSAGQSHPIPTRAFPWSDSRDKRRKLLYDTEVKPRKFINMMRYDTEAFARGEPHCYTFKTEVFEIQDPVTGAIRIHYTIDFASGQFLLEEAHPNVSLPGTTKRLRTGQFALERAPPDSTVTTELPITAKVNADLDMKHSKKGLKRRLSSGSKSIIDLVEDGSGDCLTSRVQRDSNSSSPATSTQQPTFLHGYSYRGLEWLPLSLAILKIVFKDDSLDSKTTENMKTRMGNKAKDREWIPRLDRSIAVKARDFFKEFFGVTPADNCEYYPWEIVREAFKEKKLRNMVSARQKMEEKYRLE